MQYIAGNTTPTCSYHSITPYAPSPESGGGISEMLLDKPTLLDNFRQQSCQYGFDRLAIRASIGSVACNILHRVKAP